MGRAPLRRGERRSRKEQLDELTRDRSEDLDDRIIRRFFPVLDDVLRQPVATCQPPLKAGLKLSDGSRRLETFDHRPAAPRGLSRTTQFSGERQTHLSEVVGRRGHPNPSDPYPTARRRETDETRRQRYRPSRLRVDRFAKRCARIISAEDWRRPLASPPRPECHTCRSALRRARTDPTFGVYVMALPLETGHSLERMLVQSSSTKRSYSGWAWPTAAQGLAPASWCHERRD